MAKRLGNDGRYTSKAQDQHFETVHHKRGTGNYLKKGSDLPPSGGDDGLESKYISCKFCGFVIDVTKRGPGTGYGNTNNITYAQNVTVSF